MPIIVTPDARHRYHWTPLFVQNQTGSADAQCLHTKSGGGGSRWEWGR